MESYKDSVRGRQWKLQGFYAKWLKDLATLQGRGVGNLRALHHDLNDGYLPGFEPKEGKPHIRILGPVRETWRNKPVLRYLDSHGVGSMSRPSKTRNGLSVVLRVDYGDARFLLTGDLNFRSQALLFKHIPCEEFECDVAKACHHGSEDVSWRFLQAMKPTAVLISSGDNENYAHPRAKLLGWSGAFSRKLTKGPDKQYLDLKEKRYISPLIYSTELSRSSKLWDPHRVFDSNGIPVHDPELQARGRNKKQGRRKPLSRWMFAENLIYGLINVRSDGRKDSDRRP